MTKKAVKKKKAKKAKQRRARVVKSNKTGEPIVQTPVPQHIAAVRDEGKVTKPPSVQDPLPATAAEGFVPQLPGDEVAKALAAPSISAAQAVRVELARRELARRKLLHFVLRRFPEYQAGWMHIDLCNRLEQFIQDVRDKLSPRLMVVSPPRHGKSMLVSENVEPWALGKYPDLRFISASYSAQLAEEFSRKVQDIIRSPDFKVLFPDLAIDARAQAISSWSTTKGGALLPVGVGGAMTGFGADILNIDDPVKNREEAESALISQSIWDWYTSTAYTRLMPGGGVLLTMTRWRDNDLAGRLLAQMAEGQKIMDETGVWPDDYDRWDVVHYPAIAVVDEKYRKIGDALHPARYSLAALKKIRKTIGERDWNALYQGTPTAAEGEYFKITDLRYYQGSPSGILKTYTAADLAISKKETADYSVIITVGVDEKGCWYVIDLRRGRWDSMRIIDELIAVYRAYKPGVVGIEAGQIEKAIGPFLQKRIEEERLHEMYVEPLPPGKRDKELRARPLQGRMSQGLVLFPSDAPWTQGLVNELLRFPNGTHDDQVDALSWIGQMLQIIVPPTRPLKPHRKSWRDGLKNFTGPTRYDPMAA